MNTSIITVSKLSKKYTIGERQPYYSLRDTISTIFHTPFHHKSLQKDEFWALKNISFEVREGDVLGIIGRNGAGKSTLLKILSQVTPPTNGEIKLRGKVASLLEVGTGFHPELTGRENIYLNGVLLGMKRWEINKKYSQIIEFAEVEKFLDTPVKHYSSGMYMRLAFSIAAHLEPEILLVDEVLAVGDPHFQKKCLGKMKDVSRSGRTILYVSHDLASINSLCTSAIYLDRGKIVDQGKVKTVTQKYISDLFLESGNKAEGFFINRKNPYGEKKLISKVRLLNSKGKSLPFAFMGDPLKIEVEFGDISAYKNLMIGVIFIGRNGQQITSHNSGMSKVGKDFASNTRKATFTLKKVPFTPGYYSVDVSLTWGKGIRIDYIKDAVDLNVIEKDIYNSGYTVSSDYGLVYLDAYWQLHNK
jgi:lipopolysaccharide transport system ATP-binding protein